MELLDNYYIKNPHRYFEELNKDHVDEFMASVDDQLHLALHDPKFYIRSVDVVGKYYVIKFSLDKYKDSPLSIIWEDTVDKFDMHNFIELAFSDVIDPETYFLVNMISVALAWVQDQTQG